MNTPAQSTTRLPDGLTRSIDGQDSGTSSTLLSIHRTGLADLRSHLANERTHLAYLRTSITLITFGITLNRFSIFLQEKGRGAVVVVPLLACQPGPAGTRGSDRPIVPSSWSRCC